MRAAVCEDSLADMGFLKKSLVKTCTQLHIHMEIDCFYNDRDLTAAVQNGKIYALIFYDMYMQHTDVIKSCHKIRDLLPDVQIVFLSTSQKSMLEAFDLDALHYLIKPVSTEKLRECLKRFCARIRIPLQMLEIRSDFKTYTYPLMHVQKIISYNKGVDIYLHGSELPQHIPISFIKVEKQLDPSLFLRISRGFIVQMSYISYIDKEICRLKDGTEVLISRRSKAAIRKKYKDHLFRQ